VLILCTIIFFAGIIASFAKHPNEIQRSKSKNQNSENKDQISSEFPEDSYSPANKVKTGSYSKIDRAFFLKVLELDLDGNSPSIESYLNRLNNNLSGKDVIVSHIDLANSPEAADLFNQQEKLVRSKIKVLEEEISKSSYYSVSTLNSKQAYENKLLSITTDALNI